MSEPRIEGKTQTERVEQIATNAASEIENSLFWAQSSQAAHFKAINSIKPTIVSAINRALTECVDRKSLRSETPRAPGQPSQETGRTHELKTDPKVFDAVLRGEKTFEIRFNDRDYRVGDTLVLRRTKFTGKQMRQEPVTWPLIYTGEMISRKISYILHGPIYGLQDQWVIMSLTPVCSGSKNEGVVEKTETNGCVDRHAQGGDTDQKLQDAHDHDRHHSE